LERREQRVVALQDAIDAVDRRRAELTGPESAENSPRRTSSTSSIERSSGS